MINSKILLIPYTRMKELFDKYSIKKEDKLVIACSGWSDSMFLVHEIIKIHPKKSLIVCHFNHQLRLYESNRDEKFVKDYASKNWIIFELWTQNIKKISIKEKIWIEEAARNERYKFLNEIKARYWAKYIVTAHHLDDNIETFVFNIIRWTKLNWLSGIDELSQDILRPLIHTTKKEILTKCEEEKIDYIFDSSNDNDKYLRNHIRLNIIPEFEKINPSYQKSFDSLIEYFWELKNHLHEQIISLIKINSDKKNGEIFENFFDILEFESLSSFLQKELVANIFKMKNSWTIGLTKGNIDEIIRFIFDRWNYTKKEIKKLNLFKKNWKIYF